MSLPFTADFFSQHIAHWTQWLAPLKGRPVAALEIGSYEGRSAVWLLENILTHPRAELTCVDTWQAGGDLPAAGAELFQRFWSNVSAAATAARTVPLRAPSAYWLPQLLTQGNRFDFIYVDGSHTAADVLLDAVLAWALLSPGGLIIFDDYEWAVDPNPLHRPKIGIDAFLAAYAGHYEIIARGWQVVLKKI